MKHDEGGTGLEALKMHMIVILGVANGLMSMAWIGKYSGLLSKSKSGDRIAEVNMCASYHKQRRSLLRYLSWHSVSRPFGPVNYYGTVLSCYFVILADPA